MPSTGFTSWVTNTHGRAVLAPAPVDEFADAALVLQVEAEQGLVAEQQPRVAGERLPDAEPLLFAAGQVADRFVGVVGGADGLEQRVDAGASRRLRLTGSPKRWPLTPRATRSRPRIGVPPGMSFCCGM